jgi:hypothetical protein
MPTDYKTIAEEHTGDYGKRRRHLSIYRKLYANKTHFLYELIQNANDVHASSLVLTLRQSDLLIQNNGRLFNEKDVRSICSIGRSTKDLTQAGTFGIGFKAVYAYTDAPEIYSGGERFRIRNFVIPEAIEQPLPNIVSLTRRGETVVRLPFAGRVARTDIDHLGKELRALHSWTLLFLRNLKSIKWIDENSGEEGEYRRHSKQHESITDASIVSLSVTAGKEEVSAEQFLIFSKEVTPPQTVIQELLRQSEVDEDENEENEAEEERERIHRSSEESQRIEIAFRLKNGQISSLHHCVLFSYLPTDKETHLRFLIQARYQTTPARDNVPDSVNSPWNGWLLNETEAFFPAVVSRLKEASLLAPEFFDVLPINGDRIPAMLRPTADAMMRALGDGEFIPLDGAGFGRPQRVFYPHSQRLRKLLDKQDLSGLTGTEGAAWLHSDIRNIKEHERRFEAVQSLGVSQIDASRLVSWLTEVDVGWLKRKGDDWLRELYVYLSRQKNEWDRLKMLPLIRLESGDHVSCTRLGMAFFPPGRPKGYEELIPLMNELPVIRASLLDHEEHADLERFLQEMGARPLHPAEVIRTWLLPKYDEHPPTHVGTIRKHTLYLFATLDKLSMADRRELIPEICKRPLILATKGTDDTALYRVEPRKAYLPSVYTGNEDLETFFAPSPEVYFVDVGYVDSGQNRERWREFLTELGCSSTPRLIPIPLEAARKKAIRKGTFYGPEEEEGNATLDGLDAFFAQGVSLTGAKALWRLLEKIDLKLLKGKFNWDNDYRYRLKWQNTVVFNTTALVSLRKVAWLPDDQGGFQQPVKLYDPAGDAKRLLGESVSYLHPEFELVDKQENVRARSLAQVLGIHLRADTSSALEYLRSLSGTETDPKIIRRLYQFLEENHAKPSEEFARYKLIYTYLPRPRWWFPAEAYWVDESAVFGDQRGYLQGYYRESLRIFFLGVGVSLNAQPQDYLGAIREMASSDSITWEMRRRLRHVYRRVWGALQEGKNLREGDDQQLQDSIEWREIQEGRYWLGSKAGKDEFFSLEGIVWNDHPYVANLFGGHLPFWAFDDLRDLREFLQVQPCSDAVASFKPEGDREDDEGWSQKVGEHLRWVKAFIESPRWVEQLREAASTTVLEKLRVRLVEQISVDYTLKGITVRDPEPRLSYLDDEDSVIWIALESDVGEYPDLIGDALQEYFGVMELREFCKDLLTRGLEDVLKVWQKRGFRMPLGILPAEQEEDASFTLLDQGTMPVAEEQEPESPIDAPDDTEVTTMTNWGTTPASMGGNSRGSQTVRSGSSGWSGGVGETEAHRSLKEWLANNPGHLAPGLRLVQMEFVFPSGDRVDILMETQSGDPVTVEVKTVILDGDYSGVWQAAKYKHLASMLYGRKCEDVRAILAARQISADVKRKCLEVGVQQVEVTIPNVI